LIEMDYLTIRNNQVVPLSDIPLISYDFFKETNLRLMEESEARHCVNYFGYRESGQIRLICCIADDTDHSIFITSAITPADAVLDSFTRPNANFERFEREIHENFGVEYRDHPWLKPLRYSYDRFDSSQKMENYPFVKVESDELHEVGVGPIHAGIIEPGHFRFICNGEQIMHLEIQLGYQHRGIERLFLQKSRVEERTILAENIAGDTVVGHTTAFANLWESLIGAETTNSLNFSRTIALELERIAIHTGDLAAICGDIAYQLGNSVYGRLRTPIVNFFQEWGGNRLAKGLVRVGRMNYPFTSELGDRLLDIFNAYEPDFNEITKKLWRLPSALSRMERTGELTTGEAREIGVVGMAARASGLERDVRKSHPGNLYHEISHQPVVKHHGDVYSRAQIRKEEIKQSISYIKELLQDIPDNNDVNTEGMIIQPNVFVISLVEGWRGEICHCAVTGKKGDLLLYKIKDPSFHNWMALAQAVRNNEISDFPVCNKSFNLSYCGHDL